MGDYIDPNDYIEQNNTDILQLESKADKAEVNIEEKVYGINKPYRIIIKAKISHDKD